MSSLQTAFTVVGLDVGYSQGRAGLIWDLLQHECMAPVVVLDELDKACSGRNDNDPTGFLYSLLEPVTASQFTDAAVGLPIDASQISWIATSNSIDDIDPAIAGRFTILQIDRPTPDHMPAVVASIHRDTLAREDWAGWFLQPPLAEAMAELAALSPREVRFAIEEMYSAAASAGRRSVSRADVPHLRAPTGNPRPIGFGLQQASTRNSSLAPDSHHRPRSRPASAIWRSDASSCPQACIGSTTTRLPSSLQCNARPGRMSSCNGPTCWTSACRSSRTMATSWSPASCGNLNWPPRRHAKCVAGQESCVHSVARSEFYAVTVRAHDWLRLRWRNQSRTLKSRPMTDRVTSSGGETPRSSFALPSQLLPGVEPESPAAPRRPTRPHTPSCGDTCRGCTPSERRSTTPSSFRSRLDPLKICTAGKHAMAASENLARRHANS